MLSVLGLTLGLVATVPALAAGPGLPRTYQVQVIDSPDPAPGAAFPFQIKNAGDLDRDGKDDMLMPQIAGSPGGNGQVYVISGATGGTIAKIPSPDDGGEGNKANFGFPWVDKIGANVQPGLGAFPGFTDLASCQDAAVSIGGPCRDARIGPADGIPEIVVGARGVDARGKKDAGRVYVFDGRTFSLLKKIDQPVPDTEPPALASGSTWFGRTVLNPAGVPACAGNGGVGDCETPTNPRAVQMGDMDGGGRPDLVIGASLTSENNQTAAPGSHCARTAPDGTECRSSGRVYFYFGEDIVGSSPGEILEGEANGGTREAFTRIKNPDSQNDEAGGSELFGNSLTPIGDVGTCKPIAATETRPATPVPPAGTECPRSQNQGDPDGFPDVVVSHQRADLPLDDPRPDLQDAGASYVVDGKTATILATFENPEPQRGVVFGAQVSQFASGDLGDTTKPDVFMGSPGQNTQTDTAVGRGYVMNGNLTATPAAVNISRLDDPTPVKAGNFGASHVGVGDLVPGPRTPANELVVGEGGGFYGVAPQREIITDVHVMNGVTERALQSIPDPEQQGGSSFGGDVVPLGDLNGDGFLDLAASASNFDGQVGIDQGRAYILRSDNSPAPAFVTQPPPPPPAGGPAGAPPPPPPTTAPPAGPAATPSSPGTFKAGACANQFRGTEDDDRMAGSKAGDLMFGFDGDDTLDGLDADDCLDGGEGDDRLTARSGNDRAAARAGDDSLTGGSGNDRLYGEEGRDRILGNSGNDMIAGGSGPDLLGAGTGRNRLYGEGGNDSLTSVNRSTRDLVDCGPGRDRAVVDRGDRTRGCETVTRKKIPRKSR